MQASVSLSTLQSMISKRKSVRQYAPTPLSAQTVEDMLAALDGFARLVPDTRVAWKVVDRGHIKTRMPLRWLPPQLVVFYAADVNPETETGLRHLVEVGFIGQQLDLWLQANGLGACWLGMGIMKEEKDKFLFPADAPDGLAFAMMIAVGTPEGGGQRPLAEFNRKGLDEISDRGDPRLEPARLAPSAVNSQPWYFTHDPDGKTLHVWCVRGGLIKTAPLPMNLIDMGIALAHLYVSEPDTFRFFLCDEPGSVKNGRYIGSIVL